MLKNYKTLFKEIKDLNKRSDASCVLIARLNSIYVYINFPQITLLIQHNLSQNSILENKSTFM